MKAFGFELAKDLAHAVALLGEHGAAAKILAGGTDLLADLKFSGHSPGVVIDISRLDELKDIAIADDGLHIGALVTHTEIMRSPVIRDMFPALVEAAHTIGAMQTRNLGTLGGNLVTCVPSMDSGPTLMALDAAVTVASTKGQRQMPLADLFVGPRKTSLKPGDLLVDIVIPKENLGKPAAFEKFGLRKGQALALVNVGPSFWVDERDKFVAPRIALGAVAPTVIRAPKAEAYLDGRKIIGRSDGRGRPHRCHRGKADQRFPRQRRLPARVDRRAGEAGAGQRACARQDENQGARPVTDVTLIVNGQTRSASVPPETTLLQLLREHFHLTGAKLGCDVGDCGACTVIVDGMAVNSCLMLAGQVNGRSVTTIEGLATRDRLHPIQKAFEDTGALQCGFCGPGAIMATKALLDENADPDIKDIRDALSGSLCRCTGYTKMIEAVQEAARVLRSESRNQLTHART